MKAPSDFSLRALHAALDAERRSRGISWAQATREMNGRSRPVRPSRHALSASTVKGIGTRRVAEGDGVLQMLRWLGRTAESFMGRYPEPKDARAPLPQVPEWRMLRFDTKKIHAALDARRIEREMTWAQVAKEIRTSASSLIHLSKGGRTAFPQVMRVLRWLNGTAAEFTRFSEG